MNTDTIKVSGIVLSVSPVGETDRRMTILTREEGRVSVFAQGASRARSRFAAVTRPFVTGTFELRQRSDSFSLAGADVIDYFDHFSQDYDRLAYGAYFLELAGWFSAEGLPDASLIDLLYLALKALEKEKVPVPLVRLIYEFSLFRIEGEYPQVFTCRNCGKPLKEGWFGMSERSAVCTECAEKSRAEGRSLKLPQDIHLSPAAVYALQYIYSAKPQALFSFRLSEEVFSEVEKLRRRWKNRLITHKFKSEALLPGENETPFKFLTERGCS